MILRAICEMRKNVQVDDYIGIEGTNKLTLIDDSGKWIDDIVCDVLWCGKGSPYPTPPGGPWDTVYVDGTDKQYKVAFKNFGYCFFVKSSRESDVLVHRGKKSKGCFMIEKNTTKGDVFFAYLIENRAGLQVINHMPVDNRSEADKKSHPVDYNKMIKKIV